MSDDLRALLPYIEKRLSTLAAEVERERLEVERWRGEAEAERDRSLYLSGVIDGMKGVSVEDGPTCEALERGREEGRTWRMKNIPGDVPAPQSLPKVAGKWFYSNNKAAWIRRSVGDHRVVAIADPTVTRVEGVGEASMLGTYDAAKSWCDTQLRAQGWEVGE